MKTKFWLSRASTPERGRFIRGDREADACGHSIVRLALIAAVACVAAIIIGAGSIAWADNVGGGPTVVGVYKIRRDGSNIVVYYDGPSTSLQAAASISGPWHVATNVDFHLAPTYVVPRPWAARQFFRLIYTNAPCTNPPCSG